MAIPIHCSGNPTSDKCHCGDAPDAAEAMRGIRASKPDVVIVDISMAGTSGIDLINDFKAEFEDSPVLVVSMQAESLYAERALRSGAMGYVMKHAPAKTVRAAIQKVLGGGMCLSEKSVHQRDQPVDARPVRTQKITHRHSER